jgi:hypothetical protein
MASIDDLLRRFFVLHARMQQFLHAWHVSDDRLYGSGFTSVVALDQLRHLQAALADAREEDETLRDRIAANLGWLERFAGAIQSLAHDGGAAAPELERILPLDDRARRAPVDVEPLRVRALAGAT